MRSAVTPNVGPVADRRAGRRPASTQVQVNPCRPAPPPTLAAAITESGTAARHFSLRRESEPDALLSALPPIPTETPAATAKVGPVADRRAGRRPPPTQVQVNPCRYAPPPTLAAAITESGAVAGHFGPRRESNVENVENEPKQEVV